MRPCLVAAGLLLGLTQAAAAASTDDLRALLNGVAPPAVPTGVEVGVVGWVERAGPTPELVVSLEVPAPLKLVAMPGVTVTPEPRPGVEWLDGQPASASDPIAAYFVTPPTLRLPFRSRDGEPVRALVEYAYCVVGHQCLFGEKALSVATSACGSAQVEHC